MKHTAAQQYKVIVSETVRGLPVAKSSKSWFSRIANRMNGHISHSERKRNYSPQLCRELGQEAAKKINTLAAKEKLEWLEKELSILHLQASLPKGICHCDFHPSNILFKDGELNALLDFDDANYTYLTYDLATLINPFLPSFDWHTWSHFEKEASVFDFREARETVLEYSKYRPLSHNEKRHLFDVYKLSILFDSIWYYARGDGKDFYEKRKIDHLNDVGREKFYREIFASANVQYRFFGTGHSLI